MFFLLVVIEPAVFLVWVVAAVNSVDCLALKDLVVLFVEILVEDVLLGLLAEDFLAFDA